MQVRDYHALGREAAWWRVSVQRCCLSVKVRARTCAHACVQACMSVCLSVCLSCQPCTHHPHNNAVLSCPSACLLASARPAWSVPSGIGLRPGIDVPLARIGHRACGELDSRWQGAILMHGGLEAHAGGHGSLASTQDVWMYDTRGQVDSARHHAVHM